MFFVFKEDFFVFVTDGLLRKSVVISQSLGRQGIPVTVGSSTRLSPAFFSKYCKNRVIYPAPQTNPEGFVDFMLSYLRQHRHDVLFPADDATLQVCSRYHADFEQVTHLPIPTPEQVIYGLDKARVSQVVQRLNIPHPRTALPRTAAAAQQAAAAMGGKVIIKPRASSAGRGITYVEDSARVGEKWERIHREYAYPMIQERIPSGPKFDVCVIINRRGEVVCSFVQKEIRHFPVRDGLSTVQESVWMPELVERTVALLREIGWYGVAEAEFMQNPETGEIMFMEVNPRFWASLQLAISSGIDFPHILYKVARDEPVKEQHTYRVGQRCRWLFPGDMLHYLTNPRRKEMSPSFFEFNPLNTTYDGIYRDDWRATLGVMISMGHYMFDRDLWGMLLRGAPQARPAPLQPLQQRNVSATEYIWDEIPTLFEQPQVRLESRVGKVVYTWDDRPETLTTLQYS